MINFGLIFSYILIFAAVVGTTAVPLALAIMARDFDGLKRMGISLAVMLVLFAICYAFSGNEVTEAYTKVDNSITVDATVSKTVGGGFDNDVRLYIHCLGRHSLYRSI